MNFCFRVDASIQIGSGHIIRCLTLADALTQQGHTCFFVCRRHLGNLIEFLQQRGYTVYILTVPQISNINKLSEYQQWLGVTEHQDAQETLAILMEHSIDWMVIDHYGLSAVWQRVIREQFKSIRIIAIDDLANRAHDAEIILDCGLSNTSLDYTKLNQRPALYLIGARYALLRPDFHTKRLWLEKYPKKYNPKKIRILVNLGGVDKDNLTSRILETLSYSLQVKQLNVTVVMGLNAPYKNDILKQAQNLPFHNKILINVNNMADLMVEHDLAIGAAGSTAWERCCLGLPVVMICMADNQKMIAKNLHDLGAAISINQTEIKEKLLAALQLAQSQLKDMQNKAFLITEGNGVNLLLQNIFSEEFSVC